MDGPFGQLRLSVCYHVEPNSGSPNASTACTYVSVLFLSTCCFRRSFSHFLPCLPHVDVNRLSADCDTSLRDGLSPDYPTLCAQQVNKHIKRLLSPLNEVESQREEDYSFQRVAALRASLQFVWCRHDAVSSPFSVRSQTERCHRTKA